MSKVIVADHCVRDGSCYQENSDGCEDGQGVSDRQVLRLMSGLVHANQFEDEIGETSHVGAHDYNTARLILTTSEECREKEDEDSNGDSGDCQDELGRGDLTATGDGLARDDDQELNGEAQKEEEIELQKCNVDLKNMSE